MFLDDTAANTEYLSAVGGDCQLPVHKNRTEFVSSDMLVPWNLKSSSSESKNVCNGSNAEVSTVEIENPKVEMTNKKTCSEMSESPVQVVSESASDPKLFHRYYHIFREGELELLCNSIDGCRILTSYYDQGNWCVIITKDNS